MSSGASQCERIVTVHHPTDTVEQPTFQKFFDTMDEEVRIPSHYSITRGLAESLETLDAKDMGLLARSLSGKRLGSEGYSSFLYNRYMAIHWIDDSWNL